MAKQRKASPLGPMSEGEVTKSLNMLSRLLGRQNFDNLDEANEYLGKLFEKPLDDIMAENANDSDRASDLAYEAALMEKGKAQRSLIKQALELDPDCIAARELQISYAKSEKEVETLCRELIALCRLVFDDEIRRELGGSYWVHPDAQSMLRTMRMLGILCIKKAKDDEGLALLREILSLDADDNLDIAADISLYYLVGGEPEKYFEFEAEHIDELDAYSVCIAFFARLMYYPNEIRETPELSIHGLNVYDLIIIFNELNPYLCSALIAKEHPWPTTPEIDGGTKDEALYIAASLSYILEEAPFIRFFVDAWNTHVKPAYTKQQAKRKTSASSKAAVKKKSQAKKKSTTKSKK